MDIGIWSLLPPLLALGLAFWTRQVYTSLMVGIYGGYVILHGGNPILGFFGTLDALVSVFEDSGNTRTILFCILVGGLISVIESNGGVRGFIDVVNRKLASPKGNNPVKLELYALLVGALIFVESSISILTVGTIFRPLFDKYKISRERLAYIADSCSAPICILLPFNAWGAYVIGILEDYKVPNPVGQFAASIAFNFYPILALLVLVYVILKQVNYGPLQDFENKVKATSADTDKLDSREASLDRQGDPKKMLIPLIVMVLLMPIMLAYSGWDTAVGSGLGKLGAAISGGSGSFAVLTAVTVALLSAFVLSMTGKQRITMPDLTEISLSGMGKLLPLGILMMLAFGLNTLCKELGTGFYIAHALESAEVSPVLLPAMLFVISGITAFSTGTSWGTFAIMLGIAIPVSAQLDIPLPLCLGAVLGGGVFGDHCSPISDTTIIASTAAECEHIDHVRTQIPFALLAGIGATVLYLIVGLLGT